MWERMDSHMGDMGWVGLGSLHMLLFWVLVVAAVVVVVKLLANGARQPGSSRSEARQILEERYARGEISRDELEEKRNVLNAKDGS